MLLSGQKCTETKNQDIFPHRKEFSEGHAACRIWAGTFSLRLASRGPQGGRAEVEDRVQETETRTTAVWQTQPTRKDQRTPLA